MSNLKRTRIDVKDIVEELREENNRLLTQLLFAEKCLKLFEKFRNSFNDFNNYCKCDENIANKLELNDLQNEYKNISQEFDKEIDENENNLDLKRSQTNGNKVLKRVSVNESLTKPQIKLEMSESYSDSDNWDNNESNDSNCTIKSVANEDNLDTHLDKNHINSGSQSIYSSGNRNERKTNSYYKFFCDYNNCEFKTGKKDRLEAHVRKCHSNKTKIQINCEECDHKFWTGRQLTKHIKENHNNIYDNTIQKFICNYNGCNVMFSKYNALLTHRIRHFGEKTHKCSQDFASCEWSFYTMGELRNHQKGAHKTEIETFECDFIGCGQQFKVKTHLELHKLHKHSDNVSKELMDRNSSDEHSIDSKKLKIKRGSDYSIIRHKKSNKISHLICNYDNCEFNCRTKDMIDRHLEKVHKNKTSIDCEECGNTFWTQKQLTNHIKETHNEIFDKTSQMFKCNYNGCELQFDRFSKLLLHKNRHIGEKTHKCSDEYPSCNWTFFTAGELRNHKLWSHNPQKSYICDWNGCNRQFKLKNLLEDHKRTHTGNQPFVCEWPGCDMRFVRRTALQVHRSSHIGLKSFRCDWPECGHTFRTNGNLKIHHLSHTKEKPYPCEWPGCDSRFISNSSLKRHKSVHKSESEFACYWPQCSKRFKCKSSLKIHIMSHKGEKPFKCEGIGCEMRFVDKRQMKKHFKRRHIPK